MEEKVMFITGEEFINCLKRKEIPPAPPEGCTEDGFILNVRSTYQYEVMGAVREFGMFAIVDQLWTKQLADWIDSRKCLEVMAGAGWLSKSLQEQGVDIIPTDNGSWDKIVEKQVIPVEKISGLDAVKKYSDYDILIVSWPDYDGEEICEICQEWGSTKPIVYIGEDMYGCTACDKFFDHFKVDPDFDGESIPMMVWTGIHDQVMIGYYK
jgi:hypothetical protein